MGFSLPGVPDARVIHYLVLLSVFLPYLISLIQQRQWSSQWRGRVSFLTCSLFAGAVLWNEGQLDLAHWLTTAPVFFALTATLYSRFARKNGASLLEDVSTRILQQWLGSASRNSDSPFPIPKQLAPQQGVDNDEAEHGT